MATIKHSWLDKIPISKRVVENLSWLFFERFIRLVAGLTIGVWLARYLGPEQYGRLNYAIAFVSIFAPLASLGLKDIVIRSLVRDQGGSSVTLGTAFAIRLMGGVFTLLLIIFAIQSIRPDDQLMRFLVGLLGIKVVVGTSEIVAYWYESQILSKYVVWVQNLAFVIGLILKLICLLYQAPLEWFIMILLVESVVSSFGLFLLYSFREKAVRYWKFQLGKGKALLSESWPLLLSGLSIMVYMKIDQIMLGELLGERGVGIYSAALQISEVWYMVPMIIVSTVFPIMLKNLKSDPQIFEKRYRMLASGLAMLSIGFASIISIIAGPLIELLYGASYQEAAAVLRVHVWAGLFVSLGVAGSRWYLVYDLEKLTLHRTLFGAVVNVVANLILIPSLGMVGAALSTLISYSIAAFFLDGLSRKTRNLFLVNSRAIFFGPLSFISELRVMK